jgi:hypothetical protein
MFELTYHLERVGMYETFPEAFTELYKRLSKDLKTGTTFQAIEITIWIKPDSWPQPIMFYEARDIACWMGLLVDGQLNQKFKDPMKKSTTLKEEQLEGGNKIVKCPKCHSENIKAVEMFDYVKECNDCGEQFSSGIHN